MAGAFKSMSRGSASGQNIRRCPRGEGGRKFGFTGKQGLLEKVFSTYRQAIQQAQLLDEPDLNTAIQSVHQNRALFGR
jgi:hypothetical protein